MGPIIKLRKSAEVLNQTNDEPKLKRIKIKALSKQEDKQQFSSTPKIKLKLKKKDDDLKDGNISKDSSMKVRLNFKKDEVDSGSFITKAPRFRIKPIRVPGEGYDSEASDIEDDPLIEEGIILRVLPDLQADFVKHSIESGDYSGISIKWKGERHAVVKINGFMYGAILVNLPTITEVNKSVDRRNLLKTFDISQMLLCVDIIEKEETVFDLQPTDTEDLVIKYFEDYRKEIIEFRKKLTKGYNGGALTDAESKHINSIINKGYDYKHGITPPLYNVRNRRFRRKMTATEMDYVNKTVEILLKQDEDAEVFHYELVDEDSLVPRSSSTTDISHFNQHKFIPNEMEFGGSDIMNNYQDHQDHEDFELELEQALQGSEDEYEKNHELTIDEAGDEVEQDNGEEEEDGEEEEYDDDDGDVGMSMRVMNDVTKATEKQIIDENEQHHELLKDELSELENILQHNIDKLNKATNPLLKSRFIDSIKKLEKELEIKRKQLKINEDTLFRNDHGNNTPRRVDLEDDPEDEDDEEEDEDEEDEEEGESSNRKEQGSAAIEEELDQEDMDMMILFGTENDD